MAKTHPALALPNRVAQARGTRTAMVVHLLTRRKTRRSNTLATVKLLAEIAGRMWAKYEAGMRKWQRRVAFTSQGILGCLACILLHVWLFVHRSCLERSDSSVKATTA